MLLHDIVRMNSGGFPYEIIDGVVYTINSVTDTSVMYEEIGGQEYYKIVVSGYGGFTESALTSVSWLDSTQYTFNVDAYELIESNNVRLRVVYTDGSNSDIFTPTIVESNYLFTSAINKTIEKVVITLASPGTTYIKRDTFLCYKGSSLPNPLPISGAPVVGNSYIDELGNVIPF